MGLIVDGARSAWGCLKGIASAAYVAWWWSSVLMYIVSPCRLLEEYKWAQSAADKCTEWRDYAGFGFHGYWNDLSLVVLLCLLPHTSCATKRRAWLLHSLGTAVLLVGLARLLTTVPTRVDDLIDWMGWFGYVTGKALAVFTGMLLLAISRRSALSENHSLGYIDLIAFHRKAGWWALALAVIHSLAFIVAYLLEGGVQEMLEYIFPIGVVCHRKGPCVNLPGLVNFFGLLGTLSIMTLGALSLERVRRKCYELFYFSHLVTALLFVAFGGMHFLIMVYLAIPGMVLYAYDKMVSGRFQLGDPDTKVLCPGVVCLSWRAQTPPKLSPGTRWVYVCAEGLSAIEWHPFSLIQSRSEMHVLVKANGDWSQSLFDAVQSDLPLRVKLEGPYGTPVNSRSPVSSRTLFLVAGGVGIVPYVDLLLCLSSVPEGRRQRAVLVWAVRGPEYHGMDPLFGLASLSKVADISVFVTSAIPETPTVQTSALEAKGASEPLPRYSYVGIQALLAIVLIACATRATLATLDQMFPKRGGHRSSYSSLTDFTWRARVIPELLVCAAVAFSSMGILFCSRGTALLHKRHRQSVGLGGSHTRSSQEVGLAAESALQPAGPTVHHGRPDLCECMFEAARLGPLELHACGPEKLLEAAVAAARRLQKEGWDVHVETIESAL